MTEVLDRLTSRVTAALECLEEISPSLVTGRLALARSELAKALTEARESCPTAWRPIETYPRDTEEWGKDALVLLPTCSVDIHDEGGDKPRTLVIQPFAVVAHMEGGLWLARDPSDLMCWDELIAAPTHWMPIRSRP